MKLILMIKLYSVSFCLMPTCEGVVVDIFGFNDLYILFGYKHGAIFIV